MKIVRFLSQSTGISRREAEKDVKSGKVLINEKIAEFWQSVSDDDIVKYKGRIVKKPDKFTIVALNKPKGYLSVRKDPKNRKTVMNLLPKKFQHLKPVGRLDYNSEGLLILTDCGDKLFELTHPKFEKEKEYIIDLKDDVSKDLIKRFKSGIMLDEGLAKADKVKKLDNNRILVVLHQGYNRQLRKMAEKCGNKIIKLVRIRVGNIRLENLEPGKYKIIKNEINI